MAAVAINRTQMQSQSSQIFPPKYKLVTYYRFCETMHISVFDDKMQIKLTDKKSPVENLL
jgi:hypothetical protein